MIQALFDTSIDLGERRAKVLAEHLDWYEHHGLLALLLGLDLLDLESHPGMQQRRAGLVANHVLQSSAFAQLLVAMQNIKLEPMLVFKGAALAEQVYTQAWHRTRQLRRAGQPD